MLAHLSIRNFALIERMDIELGRGFVVVTGETGAGKSIVFDAVALLVGARATSDAIRSGEDSCTVQGVFEIDAAARADVDAVLADAGIPGGEQLIVRRVVSRQGGNRVYINDTLSTVSLLTRVLDPLVELVGQHEHLTLVRPDTHRELIDRFGELESQVDEVGALVTELRAAGRQLTTLECAREARAERIEFLRFQRAELDGLALREGETAELETTLVRARHIEKLRESSSIVSRALVDADRSAVERIAEAVDALGRVAGKDPALDALAERLDELAAVVADVGDEARRCARGLESSDDDLDALESRHEELRRAFRKFACDESGAIEKLRTVVAELSDLENYEDALEKAAAAEREARLRAETAADELDAARRAAADRLFADVSGLLAELGMPDATLVLVRSETRRLGPTGWDGLEIHVSANTGEPPGPIGRIASGGELSRLLLAVKTVVSASDRLQTYTFDEVDSGIGGATAEVVGRMLAGLTRGDARRRQVLCVTHHPQIASFADEHLRAEKTVEDGRTRSRLVPLDDDEREQEIGRMLGGVRVSSATLEHARSMLTTSRAAR